LGRWRVSAECDALVSDVTSERMKFLRQSFHEWAGPSITHSLSARSYYQQQRERGKGHHAAVRGLAFI
jgi:hypothetical protein